MTARPGARHFPVRTVWIVSTKYGVPVVFRTFTEAMAYGSSLALLMRPALYRQVLAEPSSVLCLGMWRQSGFVEYAQPGDGSR